MQMIQKVEDQYLAMHLVDFLTPSGNHFFGIYKCKHFGRTSTVDVVLCVSRTEFLQWLARSCRATTCSRWSHLVG